MQILQEVIRLSNFLEKVEFKHIYRERNSKADALANAGVNVVEGHWRIKEFRGSETYETFQIFQSEIGVSMRFSGQAEYHTVYGTTLLFMSLCSRFLFCCLKHFTDYELPLCG